MYTTGPNHWSMYHTCFPTIQRVVFDQVLLKKLEFKSCMFLQTKKIYFFSKGWWHLVAFIDLYTHLYEIERHQQLMQL